MVLFKDLTNEDLLQVYEIAEGIDSSLNALENVLGEIEGNRELWDKHDPLKYIAVLKADFQPILERIENELV